MKCIHMVIDHCQQSAVSCGLSWKIRPDTWMRYEVLTAVKMKISVFRVVPPCSQAKVYRSIDGDSKHL